MPDVKCKAKIDKFLRNINNNFSLINFMFYFFTFTKNKIFHLQLKCKKLTRKGRKLIFQRTFYSPSIYTYRVIHYAQSTEEEKYYSNLKKND